MGKTRIVALSVSAGAGHLRAAEALKATAEAEMGTEVEVIHVDLMELVSAMFRKLYAESYVKVIARHPGLWGYIYDKTDYGKENSGLSRIHGAMERLSLRRLRQHLEKLDPQHIICTHFLPAQLLSRLHENGRFRRPVWVVVTDFDIHGLWLTEHMQGYFAASDEVAWRMADRGVARDRIVATGIPIMPVFRGQYAKSECLAELGLQPGRPTCLLMGGGMGMVSLDQLAERLLGLGGDLQLIALAGKNAALQDRLQVIADRSGGRMAAVGYTTTIERLMSAADIAVTKPGGLTTSECLAMGLPMIIVSPIPGQEERNADYLLEQGAAWKAQDAAGLEFRIKRLLREPERLQDLQRNARAIARPQAARAVLDRVLGGR